MAVKRKEKSDLWPAALLLGSAALAGLIFGFRKGKGEVLLSDLQALYGYNPNILSRYYDLSDVTRSAKAIELGISNTIDAQSLINAGYLAQMLLDPISEILGKLIVNSWFRNPQVNAAAGGTNTSDHLRGEAADVENTSGNNKEIIKTILQYNLPFDQMIVYDSISNPSRIHVSYNPNKLPEQQTRHAKLKSNGKYTNLNLQSLWEQVQ